MSCCCFGASVKRKSGGTSSSTHQDGEALLSSREPIASSELDKPESGISSLTCTFQFMSTSAPNANSTNMHIPVYEFPLTSRASQGTPECSCCITSIDRAYGTLKNGKIVAVKSLSVASKQGVREFMAEIETIANLRHPNLVQLLGCCVHGRHRILVYDYLENGSLDRALLGSVSTTMLVWDIRSAICMGIARGLAYLHEEVVPHIVHRDIKASNVLLDKDFTPKIGDFGLARLFPDNITHISTQIAGTTGYLAPEYALGGHLTLKADVYSFGVLVLEIISGKSSSSIAWGGVHKMLLEWAWQLYEEGTLLDLVDPVLKEYPKEVVLRYVKVALFCTQANASRRPLMSQVIEMLSRDIRLNETELTPPGFFQSSEGLSSAQSKAKSSGSYESRQITSIPSTVTQGGLSGQCGTLNTSRPQQET